MAVIAAIELDDLRPAGGGASDSQRRHPGFRPRTDETDLLSGRYRARDGFCEFDFDFDRSAIAEAMARLLMDGSDDFGISMAKDCGSVCAHIIDVSIAVLIDYVGPGRIGDKDRRGIDCFPGTDGRIDASRDHFCRPLVQPIGFFASVHFEAIDFAVVSKFDLRRFSSIKNCSLTFCNCTASLASRLTWVERPLQRSSDRKPGRTI